MHNVGVQAYWRTIQKMKDVDVKHTRQVRKIISLGSVVSHGMDEKSRALGGVVIGKRIKADTLVYTQCSLLLRPQPASNCSNLVLLVRQKLGPDNLRSIISASNQLTMAKARTSSFLSIFLVAVLCVCAAEGAIRGTILDSTLLQGSPGAGTVVITTLAPRTIVSVLCRTRSDIVFDDPWWLKVSVPASGMSGWVADYYVDCGGVGNCNVAQC